MKTKLLASVVLLVVSFSPQTAMAYDFSAVAPSGQALYYNIVDGHAEVVRPGAGSAYNNYVTGDLIIPSSVSYGGNTYSVTALAINSGYGTFSGCNGLSSISIPNTMTSIGNGAFHGCSGLTSINIPNSVTIIGDGAFESCSGLTSITISNSITTIGHDSFYGCSGLTSVTIPNTVISIGNFAFYHCSGLVSATIGSAVTSIGIDAFNGCTGLRTVEMKCYPPAIQSSTFNDVPVNIPITIPCASLSYYQNATYWNTFTHFVNGCVSITVSTNDFTLGGVSGGNEYNIGDSVIITAIPFEGSRFIGWSNGSQENPLRFVATQNASYVAAFGVGELPHDTIYIHDTVINHLRDTVMVNYYVYDTTIVNGYAYDTSIYNHYRYDTTLVFDTMIVNVYTYDTSIYNNYRFDTVILNTYQYDTTLVNMYDTIINNYYQYDTTIVYDTTIINIYDTTIVNNYRYDTVIINNYFYDTVVISHYYHDTVIVNNYVYDTIYLYKYLHDTIYIHDTIYVDPNGIEDVQTVEARIYQRDGQIVVELDEDSEPLDVRVYDAMGRLLATRQDASVHRGTPLRFDVPSAGVYLVRIGDRPAWRVVVIR